MKKYAFILFCLVAGAVALSAQQITRFAVVDTSRIYSTFLRESRSVRDSKIPGRNRRKDKLFA